MSYTAIDDSGRQVTLRKGRRCEWCGLMMPAGTLVVTRTYKWGSDLNSTRMHPECYNAMVLYDPVDDGFDGGRMIRGRPGHRDWQCAQCNKDHDDGDDFIRRGKKVLCCNICAAKYDAALAIEEGGE